MRPDPTERALFYRGSIDQMPETDIVNVLQSQLSEVCQFWRTISEELAASVQPPYTWKVRQVLDHLAGHVRHHDAILRKRLAHESSLYSAQV